MMSKSVEFFKRNTKVCARPLEFGMKFLYQTRVAVFIAFFTVLFIILSITHIDNNNNRKTPPICSVQRDVNKSNIHQSQRRVVRVATQACGNRCTDLFNLMNSILLLTEAHIELFLFVDEANHDKVNLAFQELSRCYPGKLTFYISPIYYPGMIRGNKMAETTKPCSTIRIFFPRLLPDVDAVIYLDTDMLFLRPIEELWDHFKNFNDNHTMGITPDDPNEVFNWYKRTAEFPIYKDTALNTGIMLMNLTRLRAEDFTSSIVKLYDIWWKKIWWGEQDLQNIWFSYHPEKMYDVPCEWNYRYDHCVMTNQCKGAEKDGPYVIHGNGQILLGKDNFPAYYAIYQAFVYHLSSPNAKERIPRALIQNLQNAPEVKGMCKTQLLRMYRNLKF